MQSPISRVASIAFLLVLPVTASAQERAGSFEQLRVLVKPGDTVRVTDAAGQEVRGSIAGLSSSSLALQVAGNRRTFLEDDIATIHQRRNDSLANGAKWGFAVGAGLGLLAGITLASEYEDGARALIPLLALAYGGMGAGTGAGIDAMISGDRVIYGRRGLPSKVTVRPTLTPRGTGIRASVMLRVK